MPYTALPDMRIPYDNDGTVVGYGAADANATFSQGVASYPSGAALIEYNDDDYATVVSGASVVYKYWFFFPESRELTGIMAIYGAWAGSGPSYQQLMIEGSANTTNGMDGTWETASLPGGYPAGNQSLVADYWRSAIKPVSFTGPKKAVRTMFGLISGSSGTGTSVQAIHLYGEKGAGQTADDIIWINHDNTPGAEYTAAEDFGDQPLGTTVVRQFRVKNASATKTANTINIQCNDSDFAISTDNVNWVATINIASLAAGAESATMYVRCTTPAVGSLLGPRFNRIVATVASYT